MPQQLRQELPLAPGPFDEGTARPARLRPARWRRAERKHGRHTLHLHRFGPACQRRARRTPGEVSGTPSVRLDVGGAERVSSQTPSEPFQGKGTMTLKLTAKSVL